MSARKTLNGEACPSRLNGGQAKKSIHTAAVTTPIMMGSQPAGPGVTGSRSPSALMKPSCSPQPTTQPIRVPPAPSVARLTPYNRDICADCAPRLLRIATYCV